MKVPFFFLSAITVVLAGCISPHRRSQASIKLKAFDSPTVIVEKMSFDHRDQAPILTGSVTKRTDSQETTQSHLDVTLYDAAGVVLLSRVEHFEPRQIPSRYSWPNYATYRVNLDPLPAGTSRIEVRPHEGAHPAE